MWWNVFGHGGGGRSLATFAKHNFLEMDIEFYPLGRPVEIILVPCLDDIGATFLLVILLYHIAILPDRGIVLGLEPEIAIHKPKSLAMFKMATKV